MYVFPISDQWKCLKWWQCNSTEPLATQVAVSKYYFPFFKKTEFLGEMVSSLFGEGYAQNEPGTSCVRNQRSYQRLMGTLMDQSEQQNE